MESSKCEQCGSIVTAIDRKCPMCGKRTGWAHRKSSRKVLMVITGVVITAVAALLIWIININATKPRPESAHAVDQAECERISEKMRCELCTLTEEEKRIGRLCYLEKNKDRIGITPQAP